MGPLESHFVTIACCLGWWPLFSFRWTFWIPKDSHTYFSKFCLAWHPTSVKSFIRDCEVCQHCKHETLWPVGLLQPLPIPQWIWTDISMDFVEGLSLSQGYNVIMVVVDRLSKYAYFMPLKHPYTTVSVAKCFLNNVVKLHGMPLSIVSDRDKIFISTFWKSLFKLHGTTLCYSSSYHP